HKLWTNGLEAFHEVPNPYLVVAYSPNLLTWMHCHVEMARRYVDSHEIFGCAHAPPLSMDCVRFCARPSLQIRALSPRNCSGSGRKMNGATTLSHGLNGTRLVRSAPFYRLHVRHTIRRARCA